MKRVFLIAAALLFAASANAEIREADVTGGKVAGVAANGIVSFKGIPFAAPPVGELRWRAPQPVVPWTGIREVSKFAPACVQDEMFAAVFGAPRGVSEDCLYLNVWTPATSATDRLPVMVWIYGGGFVIGQTSVPAYDGTRLAEKGVVMVSVSYRVGAFGFLAHPELSKESGKGSGNFGLQDQIAGLKWVKDNIAKFGGNPNRVTIFGESAGGISVSMLAASPAAKGLFQQAISESGGSFGGPRTGNEGGLNVPPLEIAEANGQRFLARLGATTIAAARALGPDKIMAAQGAGVAATNSFWPVFDGDVLPGDQYELYLARKFNDTPVLIGTNSDEGALFAQGPVTAAQFEQQLRASMGKHADAILAAYPHATDAEAFTSTKNFFREASFAWHTWAWAMLQTEKGRGKAFVYYFDHRTPQSPNGSNHGSEIAYVFRTLGQPGASFGPPAPIRPEDTTMAELMCTYWTNFARTGDPNGPGLPQWPAFSAKDQRVMHFDSSPSARPVPNIEQIKAFDAYYAWRREQAKAKGAR
jgi:para-nitrobenzyl esterase